MKPGIEEQLASAIGRSDEAPNIKLAEAIVADPDEDVIAELINLLNHKTSAVRSDVIKVVYEIANRKPGLIVPFSDDILKLLNHKDNRMKWGGHGSFISLKQ